jgi:Icc protein
VSDTTPAARSGPLRIAQITDTHLYADPDGRLLGLNTRHCLQGVIALALRFGPPELVVASGDLAHDGTAQAYRQVRDCFSSIGAPVCCLPGNHDEACALREHLNEGCFHTIRSRCADAWQLVFLDSTVAGSEAGHLAESELAALDAALQGRPDAPALICLHHQPVAVGSRWLDTMRVDNPEAFFAVVDRHPQVRAVLWGHVHQAFEQQRNDVLLLAAPSTCLQFLPGSERFAVEQVPPGYRWLDLYPDGTLTTGIRRLPQIPGTIDLSARGY